MSTDTPDTDHDLDEATEAQLRAIAREEARDLYGIEAESNGERRSVWEFVETISELFPDLSRRETLKLGLIAFGYFASGASVGAALMAVSGTAEAGPNDTWGTAADPWEEAHIVEATIGEINNELNIRTSDDFKTKVEGASSGTRFYLEAGEHLTSDTVSPPDNSVFLGYGSTVKVSNSGNADPVIDTGGISIEWYGGIIDGNQANQSGTTIRGLHPAASSPSRAALARYVDIRVIGCDDRAIGLRNNDRNYVVGCEVIGPDTSAAQRIEITEEDSTSGSLAVIRGCYASKANGDTILVDGRNVADAFPGARIENNLIEEFDKSQNGIGIFTSGCPGGTIANNVLIDGGSCISPGAPAATTGGAHGMTITGNTGRDLGAANNDRVVALDEFEDGVFADNHFEGAWPAGTDVIFEQSGSNDDARIVNNTIRDSNSNATGVNWETASWRVEGNTIQGASSKYDAPSGVNVAPSDVSGSRSFGSQETNNTGNSLHVIVTAANDGGAVNIRYELSGTLVGQHVNDNSPTTHRSVVEFVVPPGETYQVDDGTGSSMSIQDWHEWIEV